MWVTIVESESYTWVTLGATRKASQAAWRSGFRRHMAEQYSDAVDDWIEIAFGGEDPFEFYNGRTYHLKTGECLRDGVLV